MIPEKETGKLNYVQQIDINEYNYPLPDERIAKFPLNRRDQSKLLIYDANGDIRESVFSRLAEFLPEKSLIVLNNTRVIRARLHFTKETGARIEIFCLEPEDPHDYVLNFQARGQCRWNCLVGNLRRWKEGTLRRTLVVGNTEVTLTAERRQTYGQTHSILFRWDVHPDSVLQQSGDQSLKPDCTLQPSDDQTSSSDCVAQSSSGQPPKPDCVPQPFDAQTLNSDCTSQPSDCQPPKPERALSCTFAEILEAAGVLPIPPYLHRETEPSDLQTYQTVYSRIKGSVAAPTAGLHLTPEVLDSLDRSGFVREEITLHVGAGTFKPVQTDTLGKHEMHTEYISVDRSTVRKLLDHAGRVTAVGTTSVRTLESLYCIGAQLAVMPDATPEMLAVKQWAPYENQYPPISANEALQNILNYLDRKKSDKLVTSTQILIAPGYRFQIVNHILTNFHQPESTLLLLVSAFVQGEWRKIYDYALEHDFRFLSYGDCSLLTGK
jgi:S-adenosylmethionine:tRNA-ribosyltransferase-isomerase (queuine synthetase)